jgi:hypothetical protein
VVLQTMNAILRQFSEDGVGHADKMVRSEALNILAACRDRNPATTMRALRQLDLHGWEEAFEFPHLVRDLCHSEESMDWLANRLERLAPETGHAATNEVLHLVNWFCKAPVPLIRPHVDRFLVTMMAALPPELEPIWSNPVKFANPRVSFDLAAKRLAAAVLTTDECLARLEETLEKCAAAPDFPTEEVTELDVLCEALGKGGAVSPAVLSEWLDALQDLQFITATVVEYRAGAAVMIFKHGLLQLPVVALLRLLDLDWDWLSAEIAAALSAAGNSSTLGCLLENYSELPWGVKLYLTGVFEKLRFPEHEAALIAALDEEEDEVLGASLARALVLYDSEMSLARARKAADELDPSDEHDALVDVLMLQEMLHDIPTVEALMYFEELRKRMKASRERFALLESGIFPGFPEWGHENMLTPIPLPPIMPYRAEPQVGRNEPCPCGSGKKFKKCCGAC